LHATAETITKGLPNFKDMYYEGYRSVFTIHLL